MAKIQKETKHGKMKHNDTNYFSMQLRLTSWRPSDFSIGVWRYFRSLEVYPCTRHYNPLLIRKRS